MSFGVVSAVLLALTVQYASRLECADDKTTRLVAGAAIMSAIVKPASADPSKNYTDVSIVVHGANVSVTANAGVQFVVKAFGASAFLSPPHHEWNATNHYLAYTEVPLGDPKCVNQLYLETGLISLWDLKRQNPKPTTFSFNQINATKIVVGYALGQDFGVYVATVEVSPL
jgi:hypothetical protein